jgi:hypothetical protein
VLAVEMAVAVAMATNTMMMRMMMRMIEEVSWFHCMTHYKTFFS